MQDFSDSKVVPTAKGVYIIYDKSKGIIYVGQSGNLRRRLFGEHLSGNVNGSHFRKSLQAFLKTTSEVEITRYVANQCTFQFLATDEYRYLEHFATAVLKPLLNK